jgi:DNA-binding response OmpR family regulator
MSNKKILVVDDEEAIRDILKQGFTKAGYEVLAAKSAEEAREILRRESVMVIFLDLNLPGMNGVELCEIIRRENWIGVVYALTGYTDLFGLMECRRAGFDDFFTKPVSIRLLLEAAAEAFKKIERWGVSDYDLT